jgi:hypothetical protein
MLYQELEALAEREFITDEQYDLILRTLPAEAALHNATSPVPSRSTTATSSVTDGFAAMSISDRNSSATTISNNPPPSYSAPAPLPPRNPPQPQHKEVAHVVALYRYHDPDPRDLNFEAGDHISVTEYCNPEWGSGRNVRTGEEGIFPRNYVRIESTPSALAQPAQPSYNDEKTSGYYGVPQPTLSSYPGQQGYPQPPPPGPSSPYDGPVPPMQVANQPTEHQPGKGAEMGKKFGKKLGNAAIFGAGASIGSNLVNSIF